MSRARNLMATALLVAAPSGLTAVAAAAPSLEVGMLTVGEENGEDESIFQAGFRFAPARPRTVGPDIALAVVPEVMFSGAFVGLLDLDVGASLPLGSRLAIAPRLGLSVIGVGAYDIAGGAAGWNVGAGLVSLAGDPVGVRADVTYRGFSTAFDNGVTSWTLGLVWLGRRRDGDAPAPR